MSTRPVLWLLLLAVVAAPGCDDAFSPKGPPASSPVLYCVLELRPVQEYYPVSATLSTVYDVDGFDPLVNGEDPAIRGADITLINGARRSTLAGTSVSRPPGSHYTGEWHVYLASNVYVRTRDSLELRARLPDGRELVARTVVPTYRPLTTFPVYNRGVTTDLPSLYFGSAWTFSWDDFLREDHLFFPALRLIYNRTGPSGTERLSRPVPSRIVRLDGAESPVFPDVTSSREIAFEFAAIDATMRAISEGDPDKARYHTVAFEFELVELDFPLSRYYASVNGSLDQLSIRLDETVYSNVAGGHGVFGTSMVTTVSYPVNAAYEASFGYGPPGG